MEDFKDFLEQYYVLISAILGWFLAQLIKMIIAVFTKDKRHLINVFFSTGGMPSSHSAAVCGLSIACGIHSGFFSPLFAATAIFAAVVMTDARGVRFEAGKQAAIINRITQKLFEGDPDQVNMGLKELIGHTPFQVFMGAMLGVAIAILMKFACGVDFAGFMPMT